MKSLEQGLSGLYHLTNSGFTSRFGWVKHVVELLKLKVNLCPVSKDTFNLPAKRPGFSAMDNKRIAKKLNIVIPTWQDSVNNFLNERR
jgi:dTDP-4-dehydrorhamnose reductase